MSLAFQHSDVLKHWHIRSDSDAINFTEFDQCCFTSPSLEETIEVYESPKGAFPDLLSFWVAVARQALGVGVLSSEPDRWTKEYLEGGTVAHLTPSDLHEKLAKYTRELLPKYQPAIPQNTDGFLLVQLNCLDDAIIGVVPSGYWAFRWYTTG